tara:strand:- start:250 stop:531 length:282 start_codon:yes stop_codon:yes gene_type:complete
MQLTSIIAIYVLFWTVSAFIILPFGIRNHREMGMDMVKGQADGAPANFRPGRVLLFTTLLATTIFVLFYFNYTNQWITIDDIDFFGSRDRLGQ